MAIFAAKVRNKIETAKEIQKYISVLSVIPLKTLFFLLARGCDKWLLFKISMVLFLIKGFLLSNKWHCLD
jgi:hypothetical protein